jgi:hypothetical protein
VNKTDQKNPSSSGEKTQESTNESKDGEESKPKKKVIDAKNIKVVLLSNLKKNDGEE